MKKYNNLRGVFVDAHRGPEEIFTYIYENNIWRDAETVSGRGSRVDNTGFLRDAIADFFERKSIKTVLDVPCGDFNWFKEVKYDFEQYIGYDIVQNLVDRNNKKYGNKKTRFSKKNALEEPLEDVDIVLCRDFLIHISNRDIKKFLLNLKRTNVGGILMSHYQNCENADIPTGNRYRPIDFTKSPFLFPEPRVLIPEDIALMRDTSERHAKNKLQPLEKYLAYWSVKDISLAL